MAEQKEDFETDLPNVELQDYETLQEFAKTFPDATFVFTTRDPIHCVPSTCGMIEASTSPRRS